MRIRFENVQKKFLDGDRDLMILHDVDFEVASGEFVSLMGPSGSGKSTLLHMAAGLERPTAGRVLVGDADPGTLRGSELCHWRARRIGFIFQRYHLLSTLDAAQNVEVPLLMRKLSRRERKRRVESALELVGLSDRASHYPRQLSGGQEQRVAIARALVSDPGVLLADEPTGDLDTRAANEILELLELLHQEMKKTILMVTHDSKAADRADRTLHLEKGVLRPDRAAEPA